MKNNTKNKMASAICREKEILGYLKKARGLRKNVDGQTIVEKISITPADIENGPHYCKVANAIYHIGTVVRKKGYGKVQVSPDGMGKTPKKDLLKDLRGKYNPVARNSLGQVQSRFESGICDGKAVMMFFEEYTRNRSQEITEEPEVHSLDRNVSCGGLNEAGSLHNKYSTTGESDDQESFTF